MDMNFYIFETVVENHFTHLFRTEEMSLQDWHRFLGHPSITTLKHMPQLSEKFVAEQVQAIEQCEVCMKAKMTGDPFPILNRRSQELFELLHADICGPYSEESVSNTKFVLTIVEDHSWTIWTYLLSSKEFVYSVLHSYINMVKTHFKKEIKYVRIDNGSEFVNRKVRDLFQQYGILHQRSCIYTPQQNEIVERRHRSLLEAARSLMFQSSLPLKFWPYSILTTWMLNRTPTRVLAWRSPYAVLHGKVPDYNMFRPFGSLAYAINHVVHKSKFDSRSIKCIFLGYDAFHKGFLLFDMDNKITVISRDV